MKSTEKILTDDELDRQAREVFITRTGFTPETCPPEVEAEMLYEIEDCDD